MPLQAAVQAAKLLQQKIDAAALAVAVTASSAVQQTH